MSGIPTMDGDEDSLHVERLLRKKTYMHRAALKDAGFRLRT